MSAPGDPFEARAAAEEAEKRLRDAIAELDGRITAAHEARTALRDACREARETIRGCASDAARKQLARHLERAAEALGRPS